MKNRSKICVLFLLASYTGSLYALEAAVGIEYSSKAVWVEESKRGDDEIARMDSGTSPGPSLVIRTHPQYVWEDSNWAYHYQIDFSAFDIDTQEVPESPEVQDLGTSVSGYSVFALPVAYYHFNRDKQNEWNYKAGLGAGIGYLRIKGNFQITQGSHPEHGQKKEIDFTGLGFSVGVYFEASIGNHIIIAQNYSPKVFDHPYEYQQHNVIIAYRYAFSLENVVGKQVW
ncbi:MAG: hypothetical protein OEX00_12095 [Gammaproteobacteria bacterium]|nr:hypothetical protein [Gammaproteobacteria bacterium]MDH5692772.1 hypothetical protein [Gammaproteobacteria bacterium]